MVLSQQSKSVCSKTRWALAKKYQYRGGHEKHGRFALGKAMLMLSLAQTQMCVAPTGHMTRSTSLTQSVQVSWHQQPVALTLSAPSDFHCATDLLVSNVVYSPLLSTRVPVPSSPRALDSMRYPCHAPPFFSSDQS